MSNTFLTPSIIAREALMLLESNLIAANLVYRDYETDFTAAKVGDTITIRRPPTFSVNEFSTSISTQDITEGSVAMVLEKHYDLSVAITSKELTLSLDQFSERVIAPAMLAIAEKVDNYIFSKYLTINNYVGTAGSPPSTLANLAAVDRRLMENRVPQAGRIAFVNPAAKASMLSIDAIARADARGPEGLLALREASLGRVMGIDWYAVQNIASHTAGTLATEASATNQFLVKGAVSAGALAMSWDFNGATMTGTVVVGDVFTIANVDYAVTAAATASGNSIAISFIPSAPAAISDNATVVLARSHSANIAGNMKGIALAIVPPALPMESGIGAYVQNRGLAIRVVNDYNINTKQNVLSFDLLAGCKITQPELLTRILG